MKQLIIKIIFLNISIITLRGDNIYLLNDNLTSENRSLSVEEKYGDRIELLGIKFKDPLVLSQIFIAILFIVVFVQSGFDKIITRNENIKFFKNHFKSTILKNYSSLLLTILTFSELMCGFVLIYGVYFSFKEKTTLWIFYGFVLCVLNLLFLLFGQRIAKDYQGSSDIVIYFILIIIGIMSMY